MRWYQRNLTLPAKSRGFHLVTGDILEALPEISELQTGLLHLFLQHTSASISINENADPDVRVDLETAINRVCPEDMPFIHTCEGRDDMPAHVKSSLVGCQLTVPVSQGALALGTWQGLYLCEHRNRGGARRLVLTLMGQPFPS
ncbi:MAG: secondary thiamine-phosphate synthase enzyme YjbQ [Planctomycetota bacterium]|nr:secondary thiamine-phosphate synthase enzyme YjbQ [Planctomycetota bacterium]